MIWFKHIILSKSVDLLSSTHILGDSQKSTEWKQWFNSYNTCFCERGIIYVLIYQVQNKLNLLEGEDVSHQNDKMTKLEFLDVKRIADYAFNVYEASNADTGDLFLL